MSHPSSSNEPSHTTDAIVHEHHPYRDYFIVFVTLMVLVVATVAAAQINIPEPFSFLVALLIAIIKAILVILFFMHVKDASRVTWVFCISAFLWLVIMLSLTFADYLSRVPVGGPQAADGASPALVEQPIAH